MNPSTSVTIVIPVYNERKGIASTLDLLEETMSQSGLNYEVLVVDDGSDDGTGEIVSAVSNVRLIRHDSNLGYGAAVKTGIVEATHETVCITDADGTYPNDRIPELVRHFVEGGYDMVVGARNGTNVSIPFARRPAKWVIGRLANLSVGRKIPDINSGLRVFNREIALSFFGLLPDGFSLTTTITLAMLSNNYRVRYISIDYYARTGKSKISPIRDSINFLLLITRISLYFAPLKVFLALGLSLFSLAVAWGLVSYFVLGRIADLSTLVIALSAVQFGAIGLIAELIIHRTPNYYRNNSSRERSRAKRGDPKLQGETSAKVSNTGSSRAPR